MSPELNLNWYIKDPDLKKWVESKINEIKSYIPIILRHFYEMSWGKETDHENWPETNLQIQFNEGYFREGMIFARVFWLEFGTSEQASFFVELEEFEGKKYRLAGNDEIKFSDWLD